MKSFLDDLHFNVVKLLWLERLLKCFLGTSLNVSRLYGAMSILLGTFY
jgi:hypothetical protein